MVPYRPFGGFRFFLALLVLFSHSSWIYTSPDSLIRKVGLGNIGVMAFFVLSGFVIAEAADTFYARKPWHFLANRFLRLIPTYVGALILSLMIHYLFWDSAVALENLSSAIEFKNSSFSWTNISFNFVGISPFLSSSFFFKLFANNFTPYMFVHYSWAVLVEFYFYLGCFVLLIIDLKRRSSCWLGSCYIFLCMHLFSEYAVTLHRIFSFAPYFILGISFYRQKISSQRFWKWVGLFSFVAMIFHFSRYVQGQINFGSKWWIGLSQPQNFIAILLLVLSVIILQFLADQTVSKNVKSVDRVFGDLTYPLYLNQTAVLIVAFALGTKESGIMIGALVWIVSIVIAQGSVIAIDRPITILRATIRGRQL